MGVREGLRALRDGGAAGGDERAEREVRVILEFGERRRVEFGIGSEEDIGEGFARAKEGEEWRGEEGEKEKLGRIERTVSRTMFG